MLEDLNVDERIIFKRNLKKIFTPFVWFRRRSNDCPTKLREDWISWTVDEPSAYAAHISFIEHKKLKYRLFVYLLVCGLINDTGIRTLHCQKGGLLLNSSYELVIFGRKWSCFQNQARKISKRYGKQFYAKNVTLTVMSTWQMSSRWYTPDLHAVTIDIWAFVRSWHWCLVISRRDWCV